MSRLAVVGVALFVLACGACKKPAPPPPAEAAPRKNLRVVIVGTWTVREVKGTRPAGFTMVSTYTADGWNENTSADGKRSSREQYRVLDETTLEALGPPPERITVEVVSDDELRMTTRDGAVVLECKRRP